MDRIKKIFEEIDLAIFNCINSKPVCWEGSKFKKEYLKIKEKYLKK